MSQSETPVLPLRKEDNLRAFGKFRAGLQRPLHVESNQIIAFVKLTCYSKDKLSRYSGAVLLITGGYGIGSIRIAGGDKALIQESIYDVLECDARRYYVGRSGYELVIECTPADVSGVHRIDLEENLEGQFSWSN